MFAVTTFHQNGSFRTTSALTDPCVYHLIDNDPTPGVSLITPLDTQSSYLSYRIVSNECSLGRRRLIAVKTKSAPITYQC